MNNQELLDKLEKLEQQYMNASYIAEADSADEFHAVGVATGLGYAIKLIKEELKK